MLPLKKDSRFHQGVYKPTNQKKFIGTQCIFRSGLELKFFRFCDSNPNVLMWGSENVIIPYFSRLEHKWRKYHVDNYVKIKEGNTIKKYLVEIKPHKQTMEPVATKRKKKSNLLYEQVQWGINTDKWEAARAFCKKNDMSFLIITEKDLN